MGRIGGKNRKNSEGFLFLSPSVKKLKINKNKKTIAIIFVQGFKNEKNKGLVTKK